MKIREEIKLGNIVSYKNKEYVVVEIDIVFGGHFMIIEIIEFNKPSWFGFRKVYTLADEQIEDCIILR